MNSGSNKYITMLRLGKRLLSDDTQPSVRVALVADHSTQQFKYVLAAAMSNLGLTSSIYDAPYNAISQEIYDQNSGLHQFKPQFVYVGISVQQYRAKFYECSEKQKRDFLPEQFLEDILRTLDALLEHGYTVVVNNLAMPLERMFGNYSLMTHQSLYGSVNAFNQGLLMAVKKRQNIFINDVSYIASKIGLDSFHDERLWALSKYMSCNHALPAIAGSVAQIVAAKRGRVTKCIVLDLDNTLWGGVIGDDGIDRIKLGDDAVGESFQDFQRYILCLKERGYILAVCSKNNHETAIEVFQKHPNMILREDDIAVFIANWNPKDSNLEYISKVLNIGLDSLVFIDDSEFERNLIRKNLPSVCVPEIPEDISQYVQSLEDAGIFETILISDDDAKRNDMYRVEAQRTSEKIKYKNIDEYLQSLDMRVSIEAFNSRNIPRIVQLIQRSNQFNLRTRRFSESDCIRYARETEKCITVSMRLRDKFGDYGLIAAIFAEVRDKYLNVDELVMSCRVLKRGVEELLMNHLFRLCSIRNLAGIYGEYIPSPKNAIVKDFYKNFGFECVDLDSTKECWRLETNNYQEKTTFIEVTES